MTGRPEAGAGSDAACALSVNGIAAEANTEDFTKLRREIELAIKRMDNSLPSSGYTRKDAARNEAALHVASCMKTQYHALAGKQMKNETESPERA